MALLKDIQHPTGTSLSYWRITSLTLDMETGVTTCGISGYANKASRDAGNKSVHTFVFKWANCVTKDSLVDGTAFDICYTRAKRVVGPFEPRNQLSGATDT